MNDHHPHERALIAQSLLDYHNGVATVICGAGLPPGSRVRLILPADFSASPPSGKISGMRRSSDGGLVITVRLHSLTKEQRAALELAAGTTGSTGE